jgi:hypothetical protein
MKLSYDPPGVKVRVRINRPHDPRERTYDIDGVLTVTETDQVVELMTAEARHCWSWRGTLEGYVIYDGQVRR